MTPWPSSQTQNIRMIKTTWGFRERHLICVLTALIHQECCLPSWCIAQEFKQSGSTINRMLISHPTAFAQPDEVVHFFRIFPPQKHQTPSRPLNMWAYAIYSHYGPARKCGLNCAVIQCVYFLLNDMHEGCDQAPYILSLLRGLAPGRVHSVLIKVGIPVSLLLRCEDIGLIYQQTNCFSNS